MSSEIKNKDYITYVSDLGREDTMSSEEVLGVTENNPNFFRNVEVTGYNEMIFRKLIERDIDSYLESQSKLEKQQKENPDYVVDESYKKRFIDVCLPHKLVMNSFDVDTYEQFSDDMKVDMLIYSSNSALREEFNESLLLEAIKTNENVIYKIDNDFLQDEEFMKKAIVLNPKVFEVAFDKLKDNKELSDFAMKCEGLLIKNYFKNGRVPSNHNVKNAILNNQKSVNSISKSLPIELEKLACFVTYNNVDIFQPSVEIKKWYKEKYDSMYNNLTLEDKTLNDYFNFNRRINNIERDKFKNQVLKEITESYPNSQDSLKYIQDSEKRINAMETNLLADIEINEHIDIDRMYESIKKSEINGDTIGFSNIMAINKSSEDYYKEEIRKEELLNTSIGNSNFKEITEDDLAKLETKEEPFERKVKKQSFFGGLMNKLKGLENEVSGYDKEVGKFNSSYGNNSSDTDSNKRKNK